MRILMLLILLPVTALAGDLETVGRVTQVTVYSDRADVVREAPVRYGKGVGRIIFHGLPQGVDPASIKVGGIGDGVVISSVEVRQNFAQNLTDPQTDNLKAQLESAQLKLDSLKRKVDRLNRLQTMLLDMSAKSDVEGKARSAVDTRELLNLIVSYGDNFSSAYDETTKAVQVTAKQVELLKQQLSTMSREKRAETQVVVEYDSNQERDGVAALTYQVGGVNWTPAYGLRMPVNGEEYGFDIYGMVSQRSGEDWNGVRLTLSTALPQVGLQRPALPDWVIDVVKPVQAMTRREAAKGIEMAMQDNAVDSLLAAGAPASVTEQVAQISRRGAVTFDVPAAATVKSDGSTVKMKLSSWNLKGGSKLIAVPAETPHVFREVHLQNSLEMPLLDGEVSVFAEEKFLGSAHIPYTTMGRELVLPAGVFEGIEVERLLKKRFEDDSGLIRSMRRIRNEYEIKIRNGTATEQVVSVLESAPVSRNEKIKAVIVESEPAALAKEDPARVSKGSDGSLEWTIKLPAKGESKIGLAYEIEFEASVNVTGIEEWR